MEAASTSVATPPWAQLRQLAWRHPEWAWAFVCAAAWLFLLHTATTGQAASNGGVPGHAPFGFSAVMLCGADLAARGHGHAFGSQIGGWMAMVAAMMIPASLPRLREIGLHGLWRRRYRGPGLFLCGYVFAWTLFGLVALSLGTWARTSMALPGIELAGLVLIGGGLWGATNSKRRLLWRCHRQRGLRPRGLGADIDCVGFGAYNGVQCVGLCWSLMLAMALGAALPLMLTLTALASWERLARLPHLKLTAAISAGLGALTLLVAGTSP